MRALVFARDETPDAGRLGWLIKIESIDKRITLVFAHNCAERPPDIVPSRVVRLVIKIVMNGLFQLVILIPSAGWPVRAWCRELVTGLADRLAVFSVWLNGGR
jgi:hypothetical protein